MNKHVLFSLIFLCGFQVGFGQRFIRYNHLGYDPDRPKKLIILSDNNCKNEIWKITDSGNNIVLTDTIQDRIAGMGEYTPKLFNYSIDFTALNKEGTYTFNLNQAKPVTIIIKKQPYAFVTKEVIRYLRQQRSGTNLAIDHIVRASFIIKLRLKMIAGNLPLLPLTWLAAGTMPEITSNLH